MEVIQQIAARGKSVVLIGLGNIGACVAGLLARLDGIERLILIDRDTYDESNLASQDIVSGDIGRPKAEAQADRAHRINPRLRVEAIVDDVELVPLSLLRADLCVAGLDSRRARQYVNQAAWRLGMPWVDAGVQAENLLARVNVYLPGPDRSCLECAWDEHDYQLIEQSYPCGGQASVPAATGAPAGLGGLAGALQVLECDKLLRGEWENAAVGKQILVNARTHRYFVTTICRSPTCLFDHETWQIEYVDRGPDRVGVGDAFALARTLPGHDSSESPALSIEGQAFVSKLTCPACGETRALPWRLGGRLNAERSCPRCSQTMLATGFDITEQLHERDLGSSALDAPLSSLGIRSGDVVTLHSAAGRRHFQLGEFLGASQAEAIHG